MNGWTLANRSAGLRAELERAIRGMLPSRQRPSSALPRILAAMALAAAGALAALCLAPRSGAATRALARRRLDGLQRRARGIVRDAARTASERSRGAEATR